jgi:hypothetical protein
MKTYNGEGLYVNSLINNLDHDFLSRDLFFDGATDKSLRCHFQTPS